MANGRAAGRIKGFFAFIGVIAIAVGIFFGTGWNPFPSLASWLQKETATSLAKPAPPWTVRAGDEPDTATVVPNAIVVTAEGSVEVRSPGNGKLLWTRDDSWAAVAGGTRPVVVVGRTVGGGFDVYDASS